MYRHRCIGIPLVGTGEIFGTVQRLLVGILDNKFLPRNDGIYMGNFRYTSNEQACLTPLQVGEVQSCSVCFEPSSSAGDACPCCFGLAFSVCW